MLRRPERQGVSEGSGPGPLLGTDATSLPVLSRFAKEIELPQRSAALGRLLVRVVGPAGIERAETLESLGQRAALLYRAGYIGAAAPLVAGAGGSAPTSPAEAAFQALAIRVALAGGDRDRVCSGAVALLQAPADTPASIRGEGIVAQGYCGAAAGNPGAAGLAAGLAREIGGVGEGTIGALDAVAAGEPAAFQGNTRVSVTDWRLAEVAGKLDASSVGSERLEPAALFAASRSASVPPHLRIAFAEAAARIHVIDAASLADAFRQAPVSPADLAQPFSAKVEPFARRAVLFKSAEAERTPIKRARVVRAALDEARRAGLLLPIAAALAPVVDEMRPVAEIGWFAETAVEVMLAAGRFEAARRWAEFGTQPGVTADRSQLSLAHWLALIDIADPAQRGGRGQALAQVEEMAMRGRFAPDALHRLATVLDALDFQVPMRLWEAASRAPQPTTGHLPPTGVLSELQDAAKRREPLRVALLVNRTLGAQGPEGAHMIGLGDTIRALRRVGLEAEAREIAAEALFGLWPRASNS